MSGELGWAPRGETHDIRTHFVVRFWLAILTESGTAFLGLGAEPPTASWGKELRVGYTYFERVPLFSLAPGVMITLTVLAFNFVGDGLRDALDPRLRGDRLR